MACPGLGNAEGRSSQRDIPPAPRRLRRAAHAPQIRPWLCNSAQPMAEPALVREKGPSCHRPLQQRRRSLAPHPYSSSSENFLALRWHSPRPGVLPPTGGTLSTITSEQTCACHPPTNSLCDRTTRHHKSRQCRRVGSNPEVTQTGTVRATSRCQVPTWRDR